MSLSVKKEPIENRSLFRLSNDETKSFKILPIRSMSVTNPIEMNVAQTLTAADARSGEESAAKAGVNAELI